MKLNKLPKWIWYIVFAELVGVLSALLSGGFSDFFQNYEKPPLLPPAWLFPVVWVILYALMGFSAYFIAETPKGKKRTNALMIYYVQLVWNFLWSIVFFRFEALWGAFFIIILLLLSMISMIKKFKEISWIPAYLNIPYFIWVAFAAYLNLATAIIN